MPWKALPVFLFCFRRAVARRRVPVRARQNLGDGPWCPTLRTHVAQTEDMAMRTFDPTPLWRSTVGFDRLFNLIDESTRWTGEDNYPPYNIARTDEDRHQISLA